MEFKSAATAIVAIVCTLFLGGCGGTGATGTLGLGNPNSPPPSGSPAVPHISHVVLVMEENHSFADVAGSAAMPYLNSLAQQYSLMTQYYADTHPSIGNYFELTTGQIITNDDAFSGTVSDANLARQFATDQKSWRVYAEGLPATGYTGGDVYPYARHHNPFSYFSDVINSAAAQQNLVAFSQFSADLNAGSLPAFSLVIPNLNNDAHDCPAGMATCADSDKLAAADAWLRNNIAPLLSSSQFQASGLLFIVFDESEIIDIVNGGGHVAAIAAGTQVKGGYQATATYQHQNLLSTVCAAMALTACPGAGQSAAPISEIFK
ncbi:MAG: hypothetical protein JO041_06920 [Acidobacteria bacterium]|nr:hypothetical protein [Acidobacteriota bacterium]